jgi:N-acetylglucosaminyldiphosphoundecaprenol N-acetyl-beta-D-mannosaminyltransferase
MDRSTHGAVGPLTFSVMPFTAAVENIENRARSLGQDKRPGCAVHFCNAYNVALAARNPEYLAILQSGDVIFSDGVPITWVGKAAHPHLRETWERVYGPDVMTAILNRSTKDGPRHYLLGGTTETLEALQTNITRRFPNARIVGAESPPFRSPSPTELTERDTRIRESKATMVWVGLGTPKQDYEVARLANSLPVVALAVGAAFDFLAETTTQAPVWMQKNGLEWAYRFAQEPRRLGHRYLWGNSVFLQQSMKTLLHTRGMSRRRSPES